jgi:hypothetical protein
MCDNMNGYRGHYSKWSKPEILAQMLYDATSIRYVIQTFVTIIVENITLEWWKAYFGSRFRKFGVCGEAERGGEHMVEHSCSPHGWIAKEREEGAGGQYPHPEYAHPLMT